MALPAHAQRASGLGDGEPERLQAQLPENLARVWRIVHLHAEYLATFAQRVGDLFPGCPIEERRAIAEHACQKYSGRIGRSATRGGRDSPALRL